MENIMPPPPPPLPYPSDISAANTAVTNCTNKNYFSAKYCPCKLTKLPHRCSKGHLTSLNQLQGKL